MQQQQQPNSSRDRDKHLSLAAANKSCDKFLGTQTDKTLCIEKRNDSGFHNKKGFIIKMSKQNLPSRFSCHAKAETQTKTLHCSTTKTERERVVAIKTLKSTLKFKWRRQLSVSLSSTLLFLQIGLLFLCSEAVATRQSHYVHWNTTNPIFRIDNTDHIIDVNRGNKPWEYDQVNIICPVYRPGTHSDDIETYIIYSVSKDEYESCRITNPNPRVIAICNKPHELMYFTITFRSFTPTPGGMEFKPGEDYYFISTSAKGDLNRRAGGHCSSHHMKVAFKVANNQHEVPTTSSKPRPQVNAPRHYGHDGEPSFQQNGGNPFLMEPNDPDHDEENSEDLLQTYWSGKGYFGGNYAKPVAPSGARPNKKRDDTFDRHPNEVVKHEASRMASNTQPQNKASFSTLLLISLCLVFLARHARNIVP